MDITKAYGEGTLCLPIKEGKILLAEKVRKIGVGALNGTGGGIEPGETRGECVVRESFKELGIAIDPRNLEHVAIIDFFNRMPGDRIFHARIWIYIAHGWEGDVVANEEEMTNPGLYPVTNPPFDRMMPSDRRWFPEIFFKGRKILGEFHCGPNQRSLECEPIMLDLPAELVDHF